MSTEDELAKEAATTEPTSKNAIITRLHIPLMDSSNNGKGE